MTKKTKLKRYVIINAGQTVVGDFNTFHEVTSNAAALMSNANGQAAFTCFDMTAFSDEAFCHWFVDHTETIFCLEKPGPFYKKRVAIVKKLPRLYA